MPLVIDTYSDYFFYLQYRRRAVPLTIRSNKLALQYFSLLYGNIETSELMPIHMVRFYEFLSQRKRLQKNKNGKYEPLSSYTIYKVMIKLRAFVRRLKSEGLLGDLDTIDVPVGVRPRLLPKYLTKDELKKILLYLDQHATEKGLSEFKKYNAYLYRAIIWFLYTTGLRCNEFRLLKISDINLDQLVGAVLGKGNKYAPITFSETARLHLKAYLELRHRMFPGVKFEYVFTGYRAGFTQKANLPIAAQALNLIVTLIGERAKIGRKTNTHLFRHTLATHLVQSGCTLPQIRDKLRHSSIEVTNAYLHCSPFEQMSITKNIDTQILGISD